MFASEGLRPDDGVGGTRAVLRDVCLASTHGVLNVDSAKCGPLVQGPQGKRPAKIVSDAVASMETVVRPCCLNVVGIATRRDKPRMSRARVNPRTEL